MKSLMITTVLVALLSMVFTVAALPNAVASMELSPEVRHEVQPAGLTPRQDFFQGLICCPVPGQPFKPVEWSFVYATVGQLYAQAGVFSVNENSCYLRACYKGAGLHVCHSGSAGAISITDYDVAYAVDNYILGCYKGGEPDLVCGQYFDKDNWNVFVSTC